MMSKLLVEEAGGVVLPCMPRFLSPWDFGDVPPFVVACGAVVPTVRQRLLVSANHDAFDEDLFRSWFEGEGFLLVRGYSRDAGRADVVDEMPLGPQHVFDFPLRLAVDGVNFKFNTAKDVAALVDHRQIWFTQGEIEVTARGTDAQKRPCVALLVGQGVDREASVGRVRQRIREASSDSGTVIHVSVNKDMVPAEVGDEATGEGDDLASFFRWRNANGVSVPEPARHVPPPGMNVNRAPVQTIGDYEILLTLCESPPARPKTATLAKSIGYRELSVSFPATTPRGVASTRGVWGHAEKQRTGDAVIPQEGGWRRTRRRRWGRGRR